MLPQLAHLKMMSFIVYAELSLEALALPICRALGTSPRTGGLHLCHCRGRLKLHIAMQHSQEGKWEIWVRFVVRVTWDSR